MGADVLILSGSARSDGNTARMVSRLAERIGGGAQVINLNEMTIGPYGYGGAYDRDDFACVVSAMLAHRRLLFATPVYWYAMSGLMKTLFDRFSDLLGRPEGRALGGRELWLVANGTDAALPDGFEVPFARTAEWFDMDWCGTTYLAMGDDGPSDEAALASLDDLARALGA
jgi:multimeric flavodoxin WrbA